MGVDEPSIPTKRLSNDEIAEVRKLHKENPTSYSRLKLAKMFGMSTTSIRYHLLPENINTNPHTVRKIQRASNETILKILKLYKENHSRYEIAREVNMAVSAIWRYTSHLPKNNYVKSVNRTPQQTIDKIQSLCLEGKNTREISEAIGINMSICYKYASVVSTKVKQTQKAKAKEQAASFSKMREAGVSVVSISKSTGVPYHTVLYRLEQHKSTSLFKY